MYFDGYCPKCDSHDIERVHIDSGQSYIAEVYICESCGIQFTAEYGDPIVQDVRNSEGEDITREVLA